MQPGSHAANDGKAYRMFVLGMLSATYAVNYIDRQILAILLEPIKAEFGISDSVLGLLAGPAFALFYATMGVPIAILADRGSRKRIIAVALAFFSLMTAACGFAVHFWQLVLARVLTGVGEAGTGPASQSIITDTVPPERRASAQAVYATGANIGVMIAFLSGGWIAQHYGWRLAFLAAALPGLLLAVVILVFLREPARRGAADSSAAPSLRETARYLWQQRSYRHIVIGTGLSAFSAYGVNTFVPAFLMRSHGLEPAQVGLVFALILGAGGGLGTYFSGVIVDRLGRRDVRWNMYVPMLAAFVSLPFWPLFLLSPGITATILGAIVPLSLGAVFIGPCIATMQGLAPPRMRARAAAIQLFIGNMIGLGLGPQIVGILSDLLRPVFGQDSLRYALMAGIAASLLSSISYWRASRALPADLARTAALHPESRRDLDTTGTTDTTVPSLR